MDLENYLKNHHKTHLIFDLDETIVHLILPWAKLIKSLEEELEKMDKDLYEQTLKKGYFLYALENSYVKKYGNKAKNFILKRRVEFEKNQLQDIKLNPQIIDFIRKSKDYKLYIWSSNTHRTLGNVLKSINLEDKFAKIITDDDVVFLKPEIDGFNKIYDGKIPKNQYLFIGDSPADREAAQKAGIDFYCVDYFKLTRNKPSYFK